MKKISILLSVVVLSLGLLSIPVGKAQAATGSWTEVGKKGCKVRVWVDAYTYSKKASTIDWYGETNGKCGTLNYTAYLRVSEGASQYQLKGSFSKRTPTKSFSINKLRKEHFSRNRVAVTLNIGSYEVQSHTITVKW
nr:hypothetical protein P5646_06625 [Bacillus velezensis]